MCQFTPAAFSLQGVPGERERLLRAPRDLPDHGGQASPRRRRPRNDELASYLSSLCSFYSLVPFFYLLVVIIGFLRCLCLLGGFVLPLSCVAS
jgi:hypothetical protein